MSNGHFDYRETAIQEIVNTVAVDIAKGMKPKPEKEHNDYWVIHEKTSPQSYYSYAGYRMFDTEEEAYSFLSRLESVVPASSELRDKYWPDSPLLYASTDKHMSGTKNREPVPVLYRLHHCVYDAYPSGVEVSNLSEEGVALMIEAYTAIRKAQFYVEMVQDLIEGGSVESARQTLNEQFEELSEEVKNKDWSECLGDDNE